MTNVTHRTNECELILGEHVLERLAVLEAQGRNHTKKLDDHADVLKEFSEVQNVVERVEPKVDQLHTDLIRYRGVLGGVLLVATSIGTFVKLFYQDIQKFFSN